MTQKGSSRLTFQYDYLGRRVEKCVYSGDTLSSRTLFVYDSFKCVEELDALNGNAVQKRHAWQPFDAGLDVLLATTDDTGTSYFLHDANKNIMQSLTMNQAIRQSHFYNPFGRLILMQQKTAFCFSSEIDDLESELMYYNYRYYGANFGRWISRDPIGEIESFLIYGFLINNPINYYDINGLLKFKWYGQWGGPGWAMGRWVNDGWSNPSNPNYQQPPTNTNRKDYKDALDACYKEHDFCYERCRNNAKCPNDFSTCFSQCDYNSITCQLKAFFTKGDILMYPAAIFGTIGLGSQGIARDVMTIIEDIPLPPHPQIIYTPPTHHNPGFTGIGWKWEF